MYETLSKRVGVVTELVSVCPEPGGSLSGSAIATWYRGSV
jgi:hypothetical protein